MSIAIPSVGTPAHRYSTNWSPSYSQKLAWRLKKFAGWVAEVTFGCRHRNITIPINDHQTCLDCGATRLYLYNTEMFFQGITDAPVFIGRWKKATLEISPEIGKDLVASSTVPARRPLDGRAAILNPGSESVLFQPQPREKAVRA